MTNPYYPNNIVIRQYTFSDQNGALYNPTTATITIEDSSGATQTTLHLTDLTQITNPGVYQLNYAIPASPAVGGIA
jgi:hypothetical protein